MIFFPEKLRIDTQAGRGPANKKYLESYDAFQTIIDKHIRYLINDFENNVISLFDEDNKPRLYTSQKRSIQDIRQIELTKLLSTFEYIFSKRPITEEPLLLIPALFDPYFDPNENIRELPEKLYLSKDEIKAIRKFYYAHIHNQTAFDYSKIISDPKKVAIDSPELICITNCIAFSTFYHWLKEQSTPFIESSNSNMKKVTYNERALYCIYTNEHITKQNSNEIANKYRLNSGACLYRSSLKLVHRTNRINPDDKSDTKNENKIKLIENVIVLLDKDQLNKDQAVDELKILKNKIQSINQ